MSLRSLTNITRKTICAAAFLLPAFSTESAQAVILGNLELTGQEFNLQLSLDDVRGAASHNGLVYVVGQDNGRAAQQVVNMTNGTISSVEYFWSLSQAANGGGTGFTGGLIQEVTIQADGTPLYVGFSDNGTLVGFQTYWGSPTNAIATGEGGSLVAVAPNGIFAGVDGASAVVGSTTLSMRTLINANPGDGIADITSDATFLVGHQIWRATNIAALEYEVLDTSSWERPTDAIGLPAIYEGVVSTPTGAIFAGEYIDANSFSSRVGLWDESGNFLGGTSEGDTFADIGIFDGEVIIGVNGLNGGALYALSDLVNALVLTDLYGQTVSLLEDSFFVGSLGMVVAGTNGSFFSTAFESSNVATPEPMTCALLLPGLIFAKRRKFN